MYIIKYTTAFKKGYKRMKKRGVDLTLLDNVIEILRQGAKLDSKYENNQTLRFITPEGLLIA